MLHLVLFSPNYLLAKVTMLCCKKVHADHYHYGTLFLSLSSLSLSLSPYIHLSPLSCLVSPPLVYI